MFHIGNFVIYGLSGVCKVEEIGTMQLSGIESDKLYYTLLPLYTKGSRLFTPVDNQKVVMRPILTKEEVYDLIDVFDEVDIIDEQQDKNRELAYKEALFSCDCKEWIRIIQTTIKRKEERIALGKKMAASDERYLKQAQDCLYGEFAVSLGIEKKEVKGFIEQRLMKNRMASVS